jgi:TIR domain
MVVSGGGFWSYVHADDEAEGGRIVSLGRDIVAEFRLQTGERVELFVDQRIGWGEDWEERISDSLVSIAFFIPVITPSFFKSAQCRRELNHFARRAEALGIRQLIMPILYADVPGLHSKDPNDDAIEIIRKYQWEDWRETRFEDQGSATYRRAVAKMASRIAEANLTLEGIVAAQGSAPVTDSSGGGHEEAESASIIEALNGALGAWDKNFDQLRHYVETITDLIIGAMREVAGANKGPRPIATRLNIGHQLAKAINSDVAALATVAIEFESNLHEVDFGIRGLIDSAASLTDPESVAATCAVFAAVRRLADTFEKSPGALSSLAETIPSLTGWSRDLHGPLRSLETSMAVLTEGLEVARPWVLLIDEAGVRCP